MISVIIPTKNNLPLLKQCVKSIRANFGLGIFSSIGAYEITVMDNGDGASARWAKRNGCEAFYANNYSFAKSCNKGVALSSGSYILLCNDDIVFTHCPSSGGIIALHPDMPIVGFRLMYPNGLIQHGGVGFDMGGNPYHLWHLAPSEHPEAVQSYPMPAVTFALVEYFSTIDATADEII